MPDYTKLQSIFRMMSPQDIHGVHGNSLGNTNQSIGIDVLKTLFDQQGGGAITAPEMKQALLSISSGTSEEQKKELHSAIRFYSSEGNLTDESIDWHVKIPGISDNRALEPLGEFERIIGSRQSLADRGKRMAIVLSTSNFISPAVRKASGAELFLNFIPTHIMSRCVPYLNVEMVFDRPVNAANKLSSPGLLRFLLGANDASKNSSSNFSQGTANSLMMNANRIASQPQVGSVQTNEHTVAGMEMFTSPQTLVNPSQVQEGSRYVPVLDPFRPLASIESLTINVSPTVGTYSYKRATLTIKLHDRSRLSEIADLIKPLVYTKTTVWLTYGWRHPPEQNNPYADFINDNMLVREPYGIVNSGYSFDSVGQVTVTLELFTKGARELRDIRITGLSETFGDIYRQIQSLAEDISTYRRQLNLDKPTGLNKEIRSFQVLEAGERGEFPDLKPSEVQSTISSLQRSLSSSGGKIDQGAATNLIDTLKKLYEQQSDEKKQLKFSFKERLENQVIATVNNLFDELQTGPDPFLMTGSRDELRLAQMGTHVKRSPFAELGDSYNKIRQGQKSTPGAMKFRKRLVSFGKIFSTFVGRGVVAIPGLDELQLFFYNFNERAGRASSQNIAEFPIDISVFFEQFKEHVARHRSDNITLEEFLKLIVQAQLGDVRGVGYGFFSHFEPFDPKNPEPQLKKGKNVEGEFEDAYAGRHNKLGPFKMPAIEIHLETTYATKAGKKVDLLRSFDQASRLDFGRRSDNYVRIMRIHVYDRQVNPYPLATSLLTRDDAGTDAQLIRTELLSDKYRDAVTKGFDGLPNDIQRSLQQDQSHGVVIEDLVSNDKIKKFVSKLIPTITYGGNASNVSNISIVTKQDAMLTSVQMMSHQSGRPGVIQPNGGGTGGLPLRIIPASVTMNCLGCPLLEYMQIYFCDMHTGTTVDNAYGITGLTHVITPGKFETQLNMTWFDSYGRYESPSTFLKEVLKIQIPT